MGYINEKIRKRFMIISGFCCVLMMVFALSMDALAAEGVVQASSANIRSSADPGSTILASVLKGDKLTIKEQATGTDGTTWYKVFIDGNTLGYVRSDLLSTTDQVPVSTTTTTTTTATPDITADNNHDNIGLNTNVTVNTEGVSSVQPVSGSVIKDQVRVRADSTTSAGIVATIKKDVVFTVNGTKTNGSNEIWYQVNYVVNGTDVTGYIRSDFVTLTGDLLPVEETPVEAPETSEGTAPVEEVEESKDFETRQEDDVWYLVDNVASAKYQISKLITTAQQNATDLISAQKKISKQNIIIIVLTIILVVMALGITLLIFKLKDLMDNDGFDSRDALPRRPRPTGNSSGKPMTRQTQSRPSQVQRRPDGTRPVQQANGQRPAGSRPVSGQGKPIQRPDGSRPAQNGNGPRPTQNGNGSRPAGSQPVSGQKKPVQRPDGTRPVHTGAAVRPSGDTSAQQIESQAKAHMESRNLEKDSTDPQTWKSKNFIADDDEFEFEFLNWDGDENHK